MILRCSCFTSVHISAIQTSSTIKPVHKRAVLPKNIVQLIRWKKRQWLKAKRTGDVTTFTLVRRNVQAALRHHHRNQEQRFVYKACRKEFFKHVCNKCGTRDKKISQNHKRISLTNHKAAVLLANEFANNFNLQCNQTSNIVSTPLLSVYTSTLLQRANSCFRPKPVLKFKQHYRWNSI